MVAGAGIAGTDGFTSSDDITGLDGFSVVDFVAGNVDAMVVLPDVLFAVDESVLAVTSDFTSPPLSRFDQPVSFRTGAAMADS